ncbi:MAG: bifunctional precorrin-2 dehydrogenase/sirohydrochlorin ferrochelatase [Lachnospiraceae bacterium]|nr:bifunctional precorrin-2 dehydrogenase/sirohydrochlorin ferrochelatase [Lachnospiraceae bacterium]
MAYFPFFIDIENKNCTIAGGGIVAARKAEMLIQFGCNITVISPFFCQEMQQLEGIKLVNRPIQLKDLENSFFVVAATNDPYINDEISGFCRKKNILVNVVDVIEECSFIFPSIYKNKAIVAGITTSGKSPQVSALVGKTIAKNVPEYYGEIADRLGTFRPIIKEEISTQLKRKKIFSLILDEMIKTENKISDEEIENIIKRAKK